MAPEHQACGAHSSERSEHEADRGRVRRLGASHKALERAADLANGAVVAVVCSADVARPDRDPAGGASAIDPADEEARSAALAEARSYLEGRGIEARYVEGLGNPADVIVQEAEDTGADLIVVGTRGLHAAKRLVLRLHQHERRAPRPLRRPRRALTSGRPRPLLHAGTELARRIRVARALAGRRVAASLARIEEVNPGSTASASSTRTRRWSKRDAAERALADGRPWVRCTAFRSRSRISRRRRASGRRWARTRSSTGFRTRAPCSSSGCSAAGAIMVGKTTTPEFAYSSFTESPLWGVTRNPWDPDRSPGGSSGGLGRGGGVGLRSARRGHRHGRLGPDPGRLVRPRRTQAELRPHPARLPADPVRHDPALRAAGADRGGRAPLPRGRPGPRRARHHVALAAARPLGPARPVRRRHAPRPRRRPRLLRGRARGRGGRSARPPTRSPTPARSSRRSTSAGGATSPTPGSTTGASTWRRSSATSSTSSGSRWTRASWRSWTPASRMGAVDFKRLEFVRTQAWKQLAPILERFDALLCPTMSQTARPVDEDDFVWYGDRGDGLYHGLDMTCHVQLRQPVPRAQRPCRLDGRWAADRPPDRRAPLPRRRGAADRRRARAGAVPGPTGGRRSRLAHVAIVNANGVDLWVEQEGDGRRRPLHLRARRRGRLLGRPGRRPARPLPRHDLRQPRRRPLGDARTGRSRSPTSPPTRPPSWTRSGSSARTSSARRWAARSRRSSRSRDPERVRSLVLNGTWCRGDRFLHEIFRNWMWSAQKADSIRDFLVAVNLWCFSPRIWNEGTMDEWLDGRRGEPLRRSRSTRSAAPPRR